MKIRLAGALSDTASLGVTKGFDARIIARRWKKLYTSQAKNVNKKKKIKANVDSLESIQ